MNASPEASTPTVISAGTVRFPNGMEEGPSESSRRHRSSAGWLGGVLVQLRSISEQRSFSGDLGEY